MTKRRALCIVTLASLQVLAGGCAGTRRLAYSPAELRAETVRQNPELPPGEVVVPYEVEPESIALARRVIEPLHSRRQQVQALARALIDPDVFDLHYMAQPTLPAREVLSGKRGNCISIASAFIGLARGLGFRAYYLDASAFANEMDRSSQELAVRISHITAVVDLGAEKITLDISGELAGMNVRRVLSDLEATALFYNNLGYEHLLANTAPENKRAEMMFRTATRLSPDLGLAWNSLGVALVRLGRFGEAAQAFETAVAHAPTEAAAYNNLGLLRSRQGDDRAAAEWFARAIELEPKSPHLSFNLGRALFRLGDLSGAERALGEALRLDPEYVEAKELLAALTPGSVALQTASLEPNRAHPMSKSGWFKKLLR